MPSGSGPTTAISKLNNLSQAANQLNLPEFPKLSEHAQKLASIDPEGVKRWEMAIEKFVKDSVFNLRGLPST